VLRLIHNLACKVRLVRAVAPCSADRTLAHQVSQVHEAGASAAWHYTLDMSSLRASLFATPDVTPRCFAPEPLFKPTRLSFNGSFATTCGRRGVKLRFGTTCSAVATVWNANPRGFLSLIACGLARAFSRHSRRGAADRILRGARGELYRRRRTAACAARSLREQ
jgi:hypothetical protein